MTWQDDMVNPAFLADLDAHDRMISSRVELVDIFGNTVDHNLDIDAASVDFKGEAAQRWAGSLDVSNPLLVPTSQDSPLDPRARLRVRLWWRLRKPDRTWWEIPVGTMRTGDLGISAGRASVGMSVPMTDVLAEAGDQYRATLQLGGANVADALTALFAFVLPEAPVVFTASTSVTLPNPYEVGGSDSRSPQQDWTDIAALAGWVARTDRLGVIIIGPAVEPADPVIDWQEGPDCAVTDLDRQITYSTMTNSVTCRSTNPEVVPPVVGVVEDTDPGSSTYVGRVSWPKTISSDAVSTVEAAVNMARATYERYRRPLETVKITILPRPDLGYRRAAVLARRTAGVAGDFAVSSWNLRMAAKPQVMTVTMMQRAIQ